MTVLIVEDGSIVAGSNTYVAAATLTAYATARGKTLVTDPTILIVRAMDYLEQLYYLGIKKTRDQSLQWPRINVLIDGYYLDSDVIPQQLKDGLCEISIAIDEGTDPLLDVSPGVKRERVEGAVEVEYKDGGNSQTINVRINNVLKKLLAGGGSGYNFNVSKG